MSVVLLSPTQSIITAHNTVLDLVEPVAQKSFTHNKYFVREQYTPHITVSNQPDTFSKPSALLGKPISLDTLVFAKHELSGWKPIRTYNLD